MMMNQTTLPDQLSIPRTESQKRMEVGGLRIYKDRNLSEYMERVINDSNKERNVGFISGTALVDCISKYPK